MQIKSEDFAKIVTYIKKEMLKRCTGEEDYRSLPEEVIMSLPTIITLPKFLEAIGEKKEKAKSKPGDEDDRGFEEWWAAYPATSYFVYKGIPFGKKATARGLRADKDKCRIKYLQALDTYNTTPERMLKALQTQVEGVKIKSLEDSVNKMERFWGSPAYLNQGHFANFLNMDEEEEETATHNENYAN